MKIFDITIKNFRGIAELQRLKVGEINSFVGKNDSGKSNSFNKNIKRCSEEKSLSCFPKCLNL